MFLVVFYLISAIANKQGHILFSRLWIDQLQLELMHWWDLDALHRRWKMASCCRPSNPLFPSLTSTERPGWSSTSLSLTSCGKSWWSESPPSQRARRTTGVPSVVSDFEWCFLKETARMLLCFCFLSIHLQIREARRAAGEELSPRQNAVHSASGNAGAEASTQGKCF